MDRYTFNDIVCDTLGEHLVASCKDVDKNKTLYVLKLDSAFILVKNSATLEEFKTLCYKIDKGIFIGVVTPLTLGDVLADNDSSIPFGSNCKALPALTIKDDNIILREKVELPLSALVSNMLMQFNSASVSPRDTFLCKLNTTVFMPLADFVENNMRETTTAHGTDSIQDKDTDNEYNILFNKDNIISIRKENNHEDIVKTARIKKSGGTTLEFLSTLIDMLDIKSVDYTYKNPYKITKVTKGGSGSRNIVLTYIDVDDDFKEKTKMLLTYECDESESTYTILCGIHVLNTQVLSITVQELAILLVKFGLMEIKNNAFYVTPRNKNVSILTEEDKPKKPHIRELLSNGYTVPRSYIED